MTHPPDLVERVAKAIYDVDPLMDSDGGDGEGFNEHHGVVPWKTLPEYGWSGDEIQKACREAAIAALTEAGAWLTDRVAKASDPNPSAKALKAAVRDPAMYRTGGE